jgi:uncharacterized protein with PQ loop repeat
MFEYLSGNPLPSREACYIACTLILTGLSIFSYTPQLIKILRTKSVEGLSLSAWIMYDAYFVFYIVLLLLDSASPALFLIAVLETLQCVIIAILVCIYRRKSDAKHENEAGSNR